APFDHRSRKNHRPWESPPHPATRDDRSCRHTKKTAPATQPAFKATPRQLDAKSRLTCCKFESRFSFSLEAHLAPIAFDNECVAVEYQAVDVAQVFLTGRIAISIGCALHPLDTRNIGELEVTVGITILLSRLWLV